MRLALLLVLLPACAAAPLPTTPPPRTECEVVVVRHAGGTARVPFVAVAPGVPSSRPWLLDGEPPLLAQVGATAWNGRLQSARLRVTEVHSLEDITAVLEVSAQECFTEFELSTGLTLWPAPSPPSSAVIARHRALHRDQDRAPAVGDAVHLFLRDPRDGLLLDAVVRPAAEEECDRASGMLSVAYRAPATVAASR